MIRSLVARLSGPSHGTPNRDNGTLHLGIKISANHLAEIESVLKVELEGIEAYDDGLRAVEVLQAEGIRVAGA